jgi:hypothetical protein
VSQADLEISVFHRSANDYGVTLRFRHPAAGQDKSASGSFALDGAALRQRQQDPAAYGEQLAAQCFHDGSVRSFLDQALAVAASQQTPLHLRLFIHPDAEALHGLRWETLRLPDSAAPLAVGEWVRFSRYLDSAGWRPARTVERDALRALVAVASPDVGGTTLAEVRTDDELAAARTGLGDIPFAALAGRGQVTLANLLARLRDGCDILYLVAHGELVDGEPQILLEREEGGRAWTSGRELAAAIGELAQPPSLVVLVSCQSAGTGEAAPAGQDGGALAGLGPRLAAAGVPAVVAMQGNVTMDTAAAFMPTFLRELRRDGVVDRAMALARGAVRARTDWWMPVLYTRLEDGQVFDLPNADDDPLFDLPPLPQLDLPDKPFHYLDWYRREDAEVFFGRGREIRNLYDRVTARDGDPLILLYGQSGVGKSSMLAAGLLPRLENSHTIRYARRDQTKGLLGTLMAALEASPGDDLGAAWRRWEAQSGKPLLAVLDQVEENFTRPNPEQPRELPDFLDALQQLFGDANSRPRGRLILGFRKEWLAEIDRRLTESVLPRAGVFLERLGREGIAEVVAGPRSRPRLRGRYGLSMADMLPGMIADDLLADRESPVAPMLAILLADMWDAAKARSYDRPVFDEDLYHEFRTRGLSLNDFLGRQLETLRHEMPAVVDSGLALDLLAYHTTPLGTAEQRTLADLEQTYSHRRGVLPGLVLRCQDLYLLVDPAKNQPGQPPASRLTHDTLAPHVRKRFDESDAPGQRARRILEGRKTDWLEEKAGAPLEGADLHTVEVGLAGVRGLSQSEMRMLAASRKLASRKRRNQIALRSILTILVIIVAAVAARATLYPHLLQMIARQSVPFVRLPDLGIGFEAYEVTNKRYRLCVDADVCDPPSPELATYGQTSQELFPVTGVAASQAARFCTWIRRHLPTLEEWKFAATRGGTVNWPWGDNEPSPEVANLCYENCELLAGAPHEVGSHKDGIEGGIYDLIGNVSEWTRTGMNEYLQPIEQWSDNDRFAVPSRLAHVGGSYVTDVYGTLVGGRLSGQPSPYVGFRCVETGMR